MKEQLKGRAGEVKATTEDTFRLQTQQSYNYWHNYAWRMIHTKALAAKLFLSTLIPNPKCLLKFHAMLP
jgi:hypothetical protein